MSLDNTLNRYDPHKIAEAKMEAIIDYRKCKRAFNQLARIKEEKEKGRNKYKI